MRMKEGPWENNTLFYTDVKKKKQLSASQRD